MPAQILDGHAQLGLKEFNMVRPIPQNESHEQLVTAAYESRCTSTASNGSDENADDQTLRNVKLRDWIAIFILSFINLINYMDRFTLAGEYLSFGGYVIVRVF